MKKKKNYNIKFQKFLQIRNKINEKENKLLLDADKK